jgi:hypothetical protein
MLSLTKSRFQALMFKKRFSEVKAKKITGTLRTLFCFMTLLEENETKNA